MDNVIYYEEYARKLCKREENLWKLTAELDGKTSDMIEKIFQWDRELDLIIIRS